MRTRLAGGGGYKGLLRVGAGPDYYGRGQTMTRGADKKRSDNGENSTQGVGFERGRRGYTEVLFGWRERFRMQGRGYK